MSSNHPLPFDARPNPPSYPTSPCISPAVTVHCIELHSSDDCQTHLENQPQSKLGESSDATYVKSSKHSLETKAEQQHPSQGDGSSEPPSHGRLLPLGQFLTVYACLSLAVLLTSLDQTVVACISPSISKSFGASQIPWVGTAYLLTQTVFAPIYGRMSDVFGRKPLFIVSQVLFLAGTAMCGAAPSMMTLIFGRAVAGVGGAGLFSMVHICISDIVTLRKRGTYHGILSAINGAGAALGPTIGGLFATRGEDGWRWSFYFQLPIGAVAGLATLIFLPNLGKSDMRLFRAKIKTIDYLGMVLFTGGSTLLLLSINLISPPTHTFTSPDVLGFFLGGISLLGVFFVWEGRGAVQPIVPLKVLRNVAVDLVFWLNFAWGYVFYAALYYVPEFYQIVDHQSALEASITLMPLVITSIVFSWASGYLTSLMGRYKWSLVISFALQVAGTALLFNAFAPELSKAVEVVVMVILGVGFGCQMQCSLVAVQSATCQKEVAMATAVRNFFRNSGGVVGIAVSGAVLHASLSSKLGTSLSSLVPHETIQQIQEHPLSLYEIPSDLVPSAVAGYVDALRLVFLIFIPMSALALLATFVLPEYSLDRDMQGEPVRHEMSSAHPYQLWYAIESVTPSRLSSRTSVNAASSRRSSKVWTQRSEVQSGTAPPRAG